MDREYRVLHITPLNYMESVIALEEQAISQEHEQRKDNAVESYRNMLRDCLAALQLPEQHIGQHAWFRRKEIIARAALRAAGVE